MKRRRNQFAQGSAERAYLNRMGRRMLKFLDEEDRKLRRSDPSLSKSSSKNIVVEMMHEMLRGWHVS